MKLVVIFITVIYHLVIKLSNILQVIPTGQRDITIIVDILFCQLFMVAGI